MSAFGQMVESQVTGNPDSASLIDRSLDTIRKHLGMEVAYLSEFVDDRSVFRAVSAPGLEHLAKPGDSHSLDDIYCRHILEGRLPELIPDTSAEPVAANLPITQAVPIGSHMSIPIRQKNGKPWGMFCCLSPNPNPSLNARDLATMRIFADLAAEQVTDKIEQEAELTEKRKRIETVIASKAYSIVYQPICKLVDSKTAGFEALCRFSEEPYRTPDIWFGEAAETGKGLDLELAVMEAAASALNHIPENHYISLNASPDTIMSSKLHNLIEHLPADRVVLEITEHAPVSDYAGLMEALGDLKESGVRLAIDDAGAGYSSLQHIVQLAPDIIKLDMSLTRGVDTNQAKRSLASALIYFARETSADIVAEGIETQSELQVLRALGVGKGQGYYLSRPVDLEMATALCLAEMHRQAI